MPCSALRSGARIGGLVSLRDFALAPDFCKVRAKPAGLARSFR